MLLRSWDWDAQAYEEIDYPDEIIAAFVNKLRTTRQWRESPDPGRDVYSMFRRFEQQLAEWRQTQRESARESVPAPSEPVPAPSGRLSMAERMARVRAARKPRQPKTA